MDNISMCYDCEKLLIQNKDAVHFNLDGQGHKESLIGIISFKPYIDEPEKRGRITYCRECAKKLLLSQISDSKNSQLDKQILDQLDILKRTQ
jgi:hypothetical protein